MSRLVGLRPTDNPTTPSDDLTAIQDEDRHSPLPAEFQADDANLVRHAALTDVGDDLEFLADLPDERLFDEFGRIHQP